MDIGENWNVLKLNKTNKNMYPTKEFLLSNFEINYSIRQLIVKYFRENKSKFKNFEYLPDEDDLVIDYIGNIRFSWQSNNSCRCHPEYETKTINVSFNDFWEWVTKTGQILE